ncbi:MAG: hypothetical protein QM675_05185 [Protaetiibacter sp.]
MPRLIAFIGTVALAASALSGCAPRAVACASWVDYTSAQEAFDDATLVVIGVAESAAGTVELPTGPAERHPIVVESVLKGEFAGPELWAFAPRDYCVENPPQPAEDPIPSGERVILLLRPIADAVALDPSAGIAPAADVASIEEWSGLTPYWTALPFPVGEELPFDPGS